MNVRMYLVLFTVSYLAWAAWTGPGSFRQVYRGMPAEERSLVRACQDETSMDFDDCVETVDRDGRKTW